MVNIFRNISGQLPFQSASESHAKYYQFYLVQPRTNSMDFMQCGQPCDVTIILISSVILVGPTSEIAVKNTTTSILTPT